MTPNTLGFHVPMLLSNDSQMNVAAVLLAMIPSSDKLKTLVFFFFLNIRYSDAEVSASKLG